MRKRSSFAFLASDRGNAAVEFALMMPVLLFMGLGAFDFGMAYSMQTGYEAATRAGFEYAFKNSSDTTGIKKRVQANIADESALDAGYPSVDENCECADGSAVACDATCSGAAPARFIEIGVRGSYQPLFDWPFLDGALPLSYTARMRVG